nr:hypothetical protein [uncultured Carboxylicivirga sp.]
MDEIGISSGGGGYNSADGAYYYVGNNNPVYVNQIGSDPAQHVGDALEMARTGYITSNGGNGTAEALYVAQSQGGGSGTILVNAIGPPLISLAGDVFEGKYNAALAKNIDMMSPYYIGEIEGKTTWAWVDPKYMRNKKLTVRGANMLIFLYNEFDTFGDLRSGAISTNQFWTKTYMNGLGSISPQYGAMFLYMDFLENVENRWNQYNSKPNALRQFNNNMNSAFEEWRRSINGGF